MSKEKKTNAAQTGGQISTNSFFKRIRDALIGSSTISCSPQSNSLTTRTMLSTLRENPFRTVLLLLTIIAVVLLGLIPPQILKLIIDRNLIPGTTEGLLQKALLYLLVLAGIGACDFAKGGILTVFGQRMVKKLRRALMNKTERIGTGYFTAHTSGEITSRFTNDVEQVNSLFTDGAISMMIDCLKIVGIVVSIWLFSYRLGVITLCVIPVIFTLTRVFQRRMLRAQVQNLEQLGRLNGHISESLRNASMIKSFSKEAYMEELYQRRLTDNFITNNRVNLYDAGYSPIIQILRAIMISLVVILSAGQLNFTGISLGMVAASIDLLSNLFSPIETLGMELQNIQRGISGLKRLNDFDREEEEPEKNSLLLREKIMMQASLDFNHVFFSYDEDTEVLHDLDIHIRAGESVAIAGRTGVGKTTMFRLIMGLLRPSAGQILLAGTDVYEIPNSEKRRLFGYVEQQFSFIAGTAAEQISLGDEETSRQQVEEAMRFVGLHEYVEKLPQGYDTPVNPQSDFSQGQKQLLAIARAIVADPAVLLLDEVTANLDAATEEMVVAVLQKAGNGRTVLSISHREKSLVQADRMIRIEQGQEQKKSE